MPGETGSTPDHHEQSFGPVHDAYLQAMARIRRTLLWRLPLICGFLLVAGWLLAVPLAAGVIVLVFLALAWMDDFDDLTLSLTAATILLILAVVLAPVMHKAALKYQAAAGDPVVSTSGYSAPAP